MGKCMKLVKDKLISAISASKSLGPMADRLNIVPIQGSFQSIQLDLSPSKKDRCEEVTLQLEDINECQSSGLEARGGTLKPTNHEHAAESMVTNTSSAQEVLCPDRGLEAYLVVIGGFAALFIAFGMMNTIGAMQTYLQEHTLRHENTSTIGWIFSLYFFFSFGGNIFIGPLFDFRGARIPMVMGTFFLTLGIFLTAQCTTVYQFILAFGVVVGCGTAFIMTATIGSIPHWFDKKKATMLGFISVAGGLGGVLWPLMLRSLFPKIGFAWTMRIIGFASIVLLGGSCFLVKSRIRKPAVKSKNIITILNDSFVLKDLYRDKVFFATSTAIFLGEFSFILTSTYLSSYAVHAGHTESQAFLVLICANGVGILGRSLPNIISDKCGYFNTMIITSTMSTLMMLVIWLPFGNKSLAVLFVFSALYMFFAASNIALTPACCARICKVEDFGKKYGTTYFIVAFGNLISLPIGGAIIGDGGEGYNKMIIFDSVLQGVATIFWLLSRHLLLQRDHTLTPTTV